MTKENALMTLNLYTEFLYEDLMKIKDDDLLKYAQKAQDTADLLTELHFSGGDDPRLGYGGRFISSVETDDYKCDLKLNPGYSWYKDMREDITGNRTVPFPYPDYGYTEDMAGFLSLHMQDDTLTNIPAEDIIASAMNEDLLRTYCCALQDKMFDDGGEAQYSSAEFHWAERFADDLNTALGERVGEAKGYIRQSVDFEDLTENEVVDMTNGLAFLRQDQLFDYGDKAYKDFVLAGEQDKFGLEDVNWTQWLYEDMRAGMTEFLAEHTGVSADDISRLSDKDLLNYSVQCMGEALSAAAQYHFSVKPVYEGENGIYTPSLYEHKTEISEMARGENKIMQTYCNDSSKWCEEFRKSVAEETKIRQTAERE